MPRYGHATTAECSSHPRQRTLFTHAEVRRTAGRIRRSGSALLGAVLVLGSTNLSEALAQERLPFDLISPAASGDGVTPQLPLSPGLKSSASRRTGSLRLPGAT